MTHVSDAIQHHSLGVQNGMQAIEFYDICGTRVVHACDTCWFHQTGAHEGSGLVALLGLVGSRHEDNLSVVLQALDEMD